MKFTQPTLLAAIVFAAASAALPTGDNSDIGARQETIGAIVARALVEGGPVLSQGLDIGVKAGKSLLGFRRDSEALDLPSRAFSDEDAYLYQRAMDEEAYGRSYTEADAGVDIGVKVGKSLLGFRRDSEALDLPRAFSDEDVHLHQRAMDEEIYSRSYTEADAGVDIGVKVGKSLLGFRRDSEALDLPRAFSDEDAHLHQRAMDEEIYGRSYTEADVLFQRSPKIAKGWMAVKREEPFELYARDPSFFSKIGHAFKSGLKKIAGLAKGMVPGAS